MSQAPDHEHAGPQGEQEHVSMHTEASSFTPQQQVSEPQVLQPIDAPQAIPIFQPQLAANMLNLLQHA
ncbi:unnamed protein product [Cuscuta campestris]|uniref:Uncharacterized protein n=1 Tax=Cuscuta campestris TaxID=132261 RepID=A0A484L430_9ASTE|nr:unnamed protein product [Cuscuta campestris]